MVFFIAAYADPKFPLRISLLIEQAILGILSMIQALSVVYMGKNLSPRLQERGKRSAGRKQYNFSFQLSQKKCQSEDGGKELS